MWNCASLRVALAVAAGTGLSPLAPPGSWLGAALLVCVAALMSGRTGMPRARVLGRRSRSLPARFRGVSDVLLMCVLLSGSAFAASMRIETQVRDVYLGEERIGTLTGIVAEFPRPTAEGTYLVMETTGHDSSSGRSVRGARVFVKVRGVLDAVLPGDTLTATGVLRAARDSRNPGGFSEAGYLFQRAAHAVFIVPAFLKPVVRRAEPRKNFLALHVSPARRWIEAAVTQHVPGQERAFLMALLLGDRGELTEETKKSFRDSGIVHLLAVSGLHTALVGMVAMIFLRGLRLSARASLLGGVATVWFYCSVSGFHPSTLRASVMVTCYVASRLLGRNSGLVSPLCTSCVILLLANPRYIWDPGFQLSFAATFSIVAATPLREFLRCPFSARERVWRFIVSPAATTCVAQLGVLPILAFHFGAVSAIAVPTNLLAIPLVSGALICSFCSLGVHGLSPQLASAPFALSWLMLRVCTLLARLASSVPGVSLELMKPGGGEAVGFLVCLAVILACVRAKSTGAPSAPERSNVRPFPPRQLATLISGLSLCWLLSVLLGAGPSCARGNGGRLRVIFLDVGQGDAAVISLPDERLVLIDGGESGEEWDCAERVLIPFLRAEGKRAFDVALITHFHSDHAGGILELLRRGKVRELLVVPSDTTTALSAVSRRLALEKGITLRSASRPDTIVNDAGVKLFVLHPSGSVSSDTSSTSLNDSSLVTVLSAGQVRFVFTGDVGATIMNGLSEHAGIGLVTVLKAPHHGSRLSLSEHFAAKARPRCVVFSAGHKNRFGHPSEEVVAAYQKRGAEVFRTARSGCVSFTLSGDSLKVNTADSEGKLPRFRQARVQRTERRLEFLALILWTEGLLTSFLSETCP